MATPLVLPTTMRLIPPALRNLYRDLLQQASPHPPATVWRQSQKGQLYLKADERHGSTRITRHLGRADDPKVMEYADELRTAAERAKENRKLVSVLKSAGFPSPPQDLGRALEVLANSGMFKSAGVVLVGTAAYICYSARLGLFLPANLMTTRNIDLCVESSDIWFPEPIELGEVLARADPAFRPVSHPRRPNPGPVTFKSKSKLHVNLITPSRRRAVVPMPALGAAAEGLRYLDFLVERPRRAVVLYGSGVPVLVPRPSRFAVHKLILSSLRQEEGDFGSKDLMQAKTLRDALRIRNSVAWDKAVAEARERGSRWEQLVDKGLRALA